MGANVLNFECMTFEYMTLKCKTSDLALNSNDLEPESEMIDDDKHSLKNLWY